MIETWQETLPHGITLSCRACGERGRPVLLFLHGFPEAAFAWDVLLEHFARPEHGGYRCVAPNLRGYEHSSAPTDARDYRARHLLQDIAALIDAESPGAPLAALVAHDWGGALAWAFANQHPKRQQRLVIVNAPHPGTYLRELQNNPAQRTASAYMNFLVRPDAARLLTENGHARLFGFFKDASWLTADVRAQYSAVWNLGVQGGLNYYCASPLHPANAHELQIPPEALRIDTPTLVLWAQDDIALLPCLCDGLDEFVPDLKLVPLHQATHWVVHEQPQRVINEINAFLKTQ